MSRRCPKPDLRGTNIAGKHVRAAARLVLARLPEIPEPWDVEEFCRVLARSRGRPLVLHAADIPALPFGMWYDDGEMDHIFYRQSATGYYRDHIILHELCHMIVGYGAVPHQTDDDSVEYVIDGRRVRTKAYRNFDEQLAEFFSSMVLREVNKRQPMGVSAVERRVAELLRGSHA